MLKPIPLNVILDQKYAHQSIIDRESIKSVDIDLWDNSIEDIIINNINIQIGLGMLFPFKDFPKNIDFRENIGFLDNKPIQQQIKEIQKIFSSFKLFKIDGKPCVPQAKPADEQQIKEIQKKFSSCSLYKIDGEPCVLQVSKPADEIFDIFEQLSSQGKLNKWVSYFLLRKSKDDITEISGYEYILDNQSIDVSPYDDKLSEDEFFEYFRFNKRNMISNKCIPVSGFTLDEINSDPYIKAFSKIVKKLYVYTSEETPTKYGKYIKWIEK